MNAEETAFAVKKSFHIIIFTLLTSSSTCSFSSLYLMSNVSKKEEATFQTIEWVSEFMLGI